MVDNEAAELCGAAWATLEIDWFQRNPVKTDEQRL
jgi:hypothetical protein